MEAQDLRIGNWVQFRHTETPVLITLGDFVREYKEEHLEDYEPIPLTEEWFDRFGFDEDGFKQYEFINWGIKVKKDPNAISEPNWIVFHGFMDQFSEIVSLKHVHQLQNLYFALTGEELELTKTWC